MKAKMISAQLVHLGGGNMQIPVNTMTPNPDFGRI